MDTTYISVLEYMTDDIACNCERGDLQCALDKWTAFSIELRNKIQETVNSLTESADAADDDDDEEI